LNLPNGHRFTVRARNLGAANGYVGSVTLNGKPLARSFIRHQEIMAGGELVFTMQATPNTAWGKAPAERPYTQTAY
jgi:putative alpha-1,2-mannosidase